ncbi:MAG: glutamyl-tRNA reductase [Chitinophagaceae bacterium]|nr:glutamyl-tRNA reductase [Chitinophagaceae bacterium]
MQKVESKNSEHLIARFCMVGISFHKTATTERSLFAITPEHQHNLLANARRQGFRSLFVLSTCNRTELYGYCDHDNSMTELLINHSQSTKSLFNSHGIVRRGRQALEYLFDVAAGLNSQITGDYEIAGQLKAAVALSRQYNLIGPLMDRTISYALQASKAVKSSTRLSQGTVSVSYAVIEWLEHISAIDQSSILVVGTGTLGRNVTRNILHYLTPASVTVTNRNEIRAAQLAAETNSSFAQFSTLQAQTALADIIIVCTHAPSYVIQKDFLSPGKAVVVIDLSIPQNADPAIRDIPGAKLVGIDEVSKCLDANLSVRNLEIPKAKKILQEHLKNFYAWLALYRHVPLINEMKNKLYALGKTECTTPDSQVNQRINKTVGCLAMNLRDKKEQGCQYINAINDFLNSGHHD